jgi:hypothetical protein
VVVSDPPPGSFFPLGTTIVECVATDGAGLADTCHFSVMVMEPNSVLVESKNIDEGEEDVTIPVHLANDVAIEALVIPLIIREVTPGAFITRMQLSWGDRLPNVPGAPLSDIAYMALYDTEDGACKEEQPGGFGTIVAVDETPWYFSAAPAGAMCYRQRAACPYLDPGSDTQGSFLMTVDVTATSGTFEIDTTCMDPSNHLVYIETGLVVTIPAFYKGIITIGDPCSCQHQSDSEPDGYVTALDLAACIDILFAGAEDIQDPSCPSPRFDFDCDTFSTALDLSGLIDHLFVSGPGPCDPCAP